MDEEPPFKIALGRFKFAAKGTLAMVLVTVCFLSLMIAFALVWRGAPDQVAQLLRWLVA